MVYYRKYRPQTISELDLALVREKLTAILSSKEMPHAFLFTGTKGLGKTSSARILAKAANCLTPNGIEPCNKCDICASITNGSNIDVLEIDAASNGGVDEIRSLREKVKFSSSGLKKKVYIIDEVHMLSTGAFNALLKTLEEPPSHVIFVLCTTETHKLPATVISRTFQIQFEKPTREELVASLSRIVKGEKLDVEKGVLEEIYERSEGSFRDGAKILEELSLNVNGSKITKELFEKIYNTSSIAHEVNDLLQNLAEKNIKKALSVIDEMAKNGSDFKIVMEKIAQDLRDLLLLKNGFETDAKDIPELSVEDISKLLDLAGEAYIQLKYAIIPQLPLELLAVKWCVINQELGNSDQVLEKEETKKEEVKKTQPPTTGHQPSNSNPETLKQLIQLVNEENKQIAALLRSCTNAILENDLLTLTAPFEFHVKKLNEAKIFEIIEKKVKEMFKDTTKVLISR